MKPEKLSFVALVTTRTSEQKQGLNLYGNFIQMPVIWEDGGLCTLKNRINISSQAKLFIRRRISNALSDVPSLEHNGYSDTFRNILQTPWGTKAGLFVDPLESHRSSVPGKTTFYRH